MNSVPSMMVPSHQVDGNSYVSVDVLWGFFKHFPSFSLHVGREQRVMSLHAEAEPPKARSNK
jgi:hypothetical protein